MTQKELRFGLVGCGTISARHAEILSTTEGLSLAAVCDPVDQRRQAMAEKHKVKHQFATLDELIASRCCDAVTICTPSGMHGEMIEAAARAGLHVLCEKPLEVNLAKVDAAIRVCRKHDVRLGVIFQRRGLMLFRRMAECVAAGKLGNLALADTYIKWHRPSKYYSADSWHGSHALEGGGALANQGVHAIDAVQWVAGGAETVMARIATRAHSVPVEDTAAVVIKYANGAIGVLEAATSSYPGEPLVFQFHGSRGTLTVSNEKITRWVEDEKDCTQAMQEEQGRWPEAGDRNAGHRALILDMAAAIREGRDPIVHGLVARESAALLEAIYESARTGRETPVPAPPKEFISGPA